MTNNHNFYDKIAKEYGAYDVSDENILREFPEKNPEDVFKQRLLDYSNTDKIALDLGCGDGKFTLSIADHFLKIFAIDTSRVLLATALKLQREKNIHNVIFEFQDATNTTYPNDYFDIVYSRRGPCPFSEVQRVLKPGGFFVGIEIAELDCKKLKEIFGRGQNYKEWDGPSRKEKNSKAFSTLGLRIIYSNDYFFTEYYSNYNHIESFLKRVPILEDFNSKIDKEKLIEYVKKNTTNKGIKLLRHKLVTVVQKL